VQPHPRTDQFVEPGVDRAFKVNMMAAFSVRTIDAVLVVMLTR
jgi:hypothetical protein